MSLRIEVPVGMNLSEINTKLSQLQGNLKETAGFLDDLERQARSGGKSRDVLINFDGKDKLSPTLDAVEDNLDGVTKGTKKLYGELKQLTKVEKGSITSLKQSLSQRKQELASLNKNSAAYTKTAQEVRKYQDALNKANGIQEGSIAALRQQAADLADAAAKTTLGSEAQKRYAAELDAVNRKIAGQSGRLKTLFDAFNKISQVQAGITAISAAFQQLASKVNELVTAQKQVETFSLALQNFGISSSQAEASLARMTDIALGLGAPLAQIETSFKRVAPSILALGGSTEDASKFVEQMAARTQTLGLNTEQTGRFMEAFAQVLAKGRLQSEELNQQISELDGAFRSQLADALNVTTAELTEMIETGQVTAPVFLEAFGKMSNGVELLKENIKSGNLTLQQLQNNIGSIRTNNLRAIAEAAEAATRAFIDLGFQFENLVSNILQTELGRFLIDLFNSVVKGINNFVRILFTAGEAFAALTDPIFGTVNALNSLGSEFGGLLGALVTATAAIITFKTVTFAFASVGPVVAGLKSISTAIAGVGAASTVASGGVSYAAAAAKTAAGKQAMGGLVGVAAKVAAALGVVGSVATGVGLVLVGGLVKAAVDQNKAFRALNDTTKDLEKELKKLEDTAEDNKDIFSKMASGIAAFGRDIFRFFTQEQNLINGSRNAYVSLLVSLGNTAKTYKELGINLKDYDSIKGVSNDTLAKAIKLSQQEVDTTQNYIQALNTQIELQKELGNLKTVKELEAQKKALEVRVKSQTNFNKALLEEKTRREALGQVVETNAETLETLNEKYAEQRSFLESGALTAMTQAQKDLNSGLISEIELNGRLIGIRLQRAEAERKAAKDQLTALDDIKAKEGELSAEGQKRYADLTKTVQEQSLLIEQAHTDAGNAFAEAMEKSFGESMGIVDKYMQAANSLVQMGDTIGESSKKGIGIAFDALNDLFEFEKSQVEESSQRYKNLATEQLRAALQKADLEKSIDKGRLQMAANIQKIEGEIAVVRLQAEQQIARARGQDDIAQSLDSVIAAQETVNEQIQNINKAEMKNIDLQHKRQQNAIILKGVNDGVYESIGEAESALGRNLTTGKQLRTEISQLKQNFDNIVKPIGSAATGMQELAKSKAFMSIQNASKDANNLNDAILEGASSFDSMEAAAGGVMTKVDAIDAGIRQAAQNASSLAKDLQTAAGIVGTPEARAMGGPVTAGQTYKVNDGGGREAFLSNSGKFKMLPPSRNMRWTAPTSGKVIPANLVDKYRRMYEGGNTHENIGSVNLDGSKVNGLSAKMDSGNLVKQIASVMNGSNGNQRITNHVTIQSQQPVADASKIMTNVALNKIRRAGGV